MKIRISSIAGFALLIVAFAAVLPEIAFAQSNSLAGTWNFVLARSRATPGPVRYKSMTLTFSDSGPAQMIAEGEDAGGKPIKATYMAVIDGKYHPVTGMPDFDSSSWNRISDTAAAYIYSKGKTTVIVGSRVLSADGKTLTFSEKTFDNKGKEMGAATLVFARPGFEVATVVPAAPSGAAQAMIIQGGPTPDESAAAAALEKGDNDEAIRLFTKVLEGKPTAQFYYDYVSRGIAYAKKNQNDMALADFDAAVKAKPDDADARFRRGNMRLTLKQYDAAIDDLTAVVEMDAMNAMAYRLRGFAYNTLGKDTLAAPDYDKACALNKELCM